jgi:hypothetical protein
MSDITNYPFGLRQNKATPIAADGSYGAPAMLKAEQTLSGQLVMSTQELRGRDMAVAAITMLEKADWSMDEGGIPFDAMKVMLGGLLTSTGLSPNKKETLGFAGSTNLSYFRLEGRAITADGGDFHMVLYRCQVTSAPQWQLQDQNFLVSNLSGVALPDPNNGNKIFDVVKNQTPVVL